MIHGHSFAFQQHADPAIAEPTPLAGNRLHLFANFWIIRRLIAQDGLGIDTRCPATHACMCERGQACTLGVVRYHDPASPCVLQPVARSVSSVLSQKIFQNYIVQHRVRQQTLQFAVLIFKRFKAVGVRNVHATVFGFELVERRGTEAMPAAHLSSWHPSFLFFDHPDNLGFGKTTLSHLFAPSKVKQTLH